MSDVDLLRRAAAKMRENAGAAPLGPWWADGFTVRDGDEGRSVAPAHNARLATATHIAAADPTFVLAVADLLDHLVTRHDEIADSIPGTQSRHILIARNSINGWNEAVAVARAYAGEAS